MDEVFKALADPSRRELLDRLRRQNGLTLRELCAGLDMARQSVSKHLQILEHAGLVTTVWQGREKLHYLNAAPINEIAERWINQYDRTRIDAIASMKHALEDTAMSRPNFVYTTYITTTPEQLWKALTSPEFTEHYWGLTFDTTWEVGAPMTWYHQGIAIEDPEQEVLESDPYRRLSYTWHSFTPEWAKRYGFDEELRTRLASETRTRASFDIEPVEDGKVRLTVVHDNFDDDSKVAEMVSEGWPRVVSELKTFLESGDVAALTP